MDFEVMYDDRTTERLTVNKSKDTTEEDVNVQLALADSLILAVDKILAEPVTKSRGARDIFSYARGLVKVRGAR